MANIELVVANGRSLCRGTSSTCIGVSQNKYYLMEKIIPKGSRALAIYAHASGKSARSYFCDQCMLSVLDDMRKVIEDVKK